MKKKRVPDGLAWSQLVFWFRNTKKIQKQRFSASGIQKVYKNKTKTTNFWFLDRKNIEKQNENNEILVSRQSWQLLTGLTGAGKSWPSSPTRFFLNNCKHSKPRDPKETDCRLILALNYARLISDVVAQDEAHSAYPLPPWWADDTEDNEYYELYDD